MNQKINVSERITGCRMAGKTCVFLAVVQVVTGLSIVCLTSGFGTSSTSSFPLPFFGMPFVLTSLPLGMAASAFFTMFDVLQSQQSEIEKLKTAIGGPQRAEQPAETM